MNERIIKAPRLSKSLKEISGFTDEEIEYFLSFHVRKFIKRKEHILRTGEISCFTSYVVKGCLRRYIIDEHAKEIIVNFALEDYWIGDLESLILRKPTVYYVQALEDSELLTLTYENYTRLYNDMPKFRIYQDSKTQRNHYMTLKRLSSAKSATPEEKYLRLMEEQPQLFLRIPLHNIASYLGIEPESLSRLRKRMSSKPKNS